MKYIHIDLIHSGYISFKIHFSSCMFTFHKLLNLSLFILSHLQIAKQSCFWMKIKIKKLIFWSHKSIILTFFHKWQYAEWTAWKTAIYWYCIQEVPYLRLRSFVRISLVPRFIVVSSTPRIVPSHMPWALPSPFFFLHHKTLSAHWAPICKLYTPIRVQSSRRWTNQMPTRDVNLKEAYQKYFVDIFLSFIHIFVTKTCFLCNIST
jgi:hypothetical protein